MSGGHVKLLSAAEYGTLINGDKGNAGGGADGNNPTNVLVNSVQSLSQTSTIVNSLKLDTAATSVTLGASSTLFVRAGALLDLSTSATVAGGTLSFDAAGNSALGFITVASGAALTISSAISGSSGVVKSGGGTLTLSGANQFAGQLAATNGLIAFSADSNLGAAATPLVFNGGVVQATSTTTMQRPITLNSTSTAIGIDVPTGITLTYGSATAGAAVIISGTGNLVKTGAGTLVLGSHTTADTFVGNTIVNGGVISYTGASDFSAVPAAFSATNFTVNNNATLQFLASTSMSALRGLTIGTGGATVDVGSGFLGDVPGGDCGNVDTLRKTGLGSLVLNYRELAALGAPNLDGGLITLSGTMNVTGTSAVGAAGTAGLQQTGGKLTAAALVVGSARRIERHVIPFPAGRSPR